MTAPTRTPSTTPPATILSKKFFREGDIPGCAASATSGINMAAVSAAALKPVAAFSLSDAQGTWKILLLNFIDGDEGPLGDSLIGLKKASDELIERLWPVQATGNDVKATAVEIIFLVFLFLF